MKNKLLLCCIITGMGIAGCEKQPTVSTVSLQAAGFTDSAVQYLKSQLSSDEFTALNTSAPNIIQYGGNKAGVRFFPKGSGQGRFILLQKKAAGFTGVWIDMTHLTKDTANKHEGAVSFLNFRHQLVCRYTIKNNLVTEIITGLPGSDANTYSRLRTAMSTPDNPQELEAFVVTTKRTAFNQDYYSAYWFFNWDDDFKNLYIPGYEGSGGGGGSSTSDMEEAPPTPGPDHPIEDIKEELKCFTVDKNAVYNVTINVNQPKPETRSLSNLGIAHKVGHAYLTIQEQLTDGTSIIRNVGFYPKHYARPGSEQDVSTFGDDSETPFCVSLKVSISANEFNNIKANIINEQTSTYDLEDFNCTTAVINTMNSINFHLPSTIGVNGVFSGYNPADLGQDIRELNLEDFNKENGNRKMVRTVRPDNKGLPLQRTGNCK